MRSIRLGRRSFSTHRTFPCFNEGLTDIVNSVPAQQTLARAQNKGTEAVLLCDASWEDIDVFFTRVDRLDQEASE